MMPKFVHIARIDKLDHTKLNLTKKCYNCLFTYYICLNYCRILIYRK